ncbi:MAG: ribosomal RNA small subunit methyltransferase A [Dehalococcoidales bacterium]|nr:ribosomal RNA small subunit methyltransferase A [Dehalococcoidales bacterium]
MTGPVPRKESLIFQTREMLRTYDLRAKKGLGQHFLVDSSALTRIVQAAGLSQHDLVLEIGPGMGVLTSELVKKAGYVVAVELDKDLYEILRSSFASYTRFSLLNKNILEVDPGQLIENEKNHMPPGLDLAGQYKLVANLPYYITQPIIRHFCEAASKPSVMVIMVQKEVARNIVAEPGDLGILAISVQFYGRPEIIDYVPAGCFFPVPKVDSAILKITLFPAPRLKVTSDKSFFTIVRAGFCARRKQVANSLAQGLDLPKAEIISLMQKAGISPQKRPETLTLEEWAVLENTFHEVLRE